MDLFYTPEFAKAGDVIPFYDERTKRFENFYLKNWNPDAPEDRIVRGWHRIKTKDNRIFEETPVNIRGGTGSILWVDGAYHMFYCTFDFDKDPVAQWARHATSTDLIHWTDIPEDKFGPDGVDRYVYGWNPTRGENSWGFDPGKELGKDYRSWNWGGRSLWKRGKSISWSSIWMGCWRCCTWIGTWRSASGCITIRGAIWDFSSRMEILRSQTPVF